MLDSIPALVHETMDTFSVPGMLVLAARGDAAPELYAVGTDAAGAPVGASALFIVASITKLATALVILRLADARELALDDPLAQYAPESPAAQPGVTLRHLLCHTAGLPVDIPDAAERYGTPFTWSDLARACLNVPLEIPPRTRVVYGNVGYGLLAVVGERVAAQPFLSVLRSEVLEPLGIEGYLGGVLPRPCMQLADIRSRHAGTAVEPYNSSYYRNLALPWAGLITTAGGALKLVQAFAGYPAHYLSAAIRADATSNQTDDLPGGYGGRFDYPRSPWGLGVDLKGDKKPHWTPPNASAGTFGHAGASGCVAWHDPVVNLSWVIAGTRTADNAWLVRGAPKIAARLIDPNSNH